MNIVIVIIFAAKTNKSQWAIYIQQTMYLNWRLVQIIDSHFSECNQNLGGLICAANLWER